MLFIYKKSDSQDANSETNSSDSPAQKTSRLGHITNDIEKKPKKAKLVFMLMLIIGHFTLEFVAGHYSNSWALIIDSLHMLSDSFSYFSSLVVLFMKKSGSSENKLSRALTQFQIFGSFANAGLLICSCVGNFNKLIKYVSYLTVSENSIYYNLFFQIFLF